MFRLEPEDLLPKSGQFQWYSSRYAHVFNVREGFDQHYKMSRTFPFTIKNICFESLFKHKNIIMLSLKKFQSLPCFNAENNLILGNVYLPGLPFC